MKNNLDLKDLFYNPQTDSIKSIIKELQKVHDNILETTDLSKGTIPSVLDDYKSEIEYFSIPQNGLVKSERVKMIAGLFKGAPRWHSPKTMYNVVPPPLVQTVISKFFNALYNPNLVLDVSSGESTLVEQKVIKAISEYIGWDWKKAGGVFTFGGKATTMYGIKLGIKKCSPSYSEYGLKDDLVVISTKTGHPSHISDSEWMGIGSKNVLRVDVDVKGIIDLENLEGIIRSVVASGKKIAAIIITGGTTNNMTVDPIAEVVDLRDRLSSELKLEYLPHIHVDAVVGFPWIFFKNYDFVNNELGISEKVLSNIKNIIRDLVFLDRADSFGIDFHKMGFCPYISSLFMVKNKKPFTGWKSDFVKYGENSPFTYTMENSRPADGPNSAYVALNILGEKGFQEIIAHCMEIAEDLKHRINLSKAFNLLNKNSLGSSIMFIPCLPQGIVINDSTEEIMFKNEYVTHFLEIIRSMGNPYFIDKVHSNSTGGVGYPSHCLKAYIMSPYASIDNNIKFIVFMEELKINIDKYFVDKFSKGNIQNTDFDHPLKYD